MAEGIWKRWTWGPALALSLGMLVPNPLNAQESWSANTMLLSEYWARSSDEFRGEGRRKEAIAAALKGIPADISEGDIEQFSLAHLALYAAVRSEHLRLPVGSRLVDPIYGLVVSTEGARAITRSSSGLELWDTAAGKPIAKMLDGELGHHFEGVAFSNDGSLLAIAGRHGSLLLYDSLDGRLIADLPAVRPVLSPPDDSPQFRSIGFNPSGTLLVASGEYPPELKVWSLPDLDLVFDFEGHHQGQFGGTGSVRTEVNARFANDLTLCVSLATIFNVLDATELVAGTIDVQDGTFDEFHRIAQPLTNLFSFYGSASCSADLEWAAVRYSDANYVPHLDLVGIASAATPRTYNQIFAFGTAFNREGSVLALQTPERWAFLDVATGEMMNSHPGVLEGFQLQAPLLFDDSTGEQVSQDTVSQPRYGASTVWATVPTGIELVETAYGELDESLRAEIDAERIE